jgi:hypothetical protein
MKEHIPTPDEPKFIVTVDVTPFFENPTVTTHHLSWKEIAFVFHEMKDQEAAREQLEALDKKLVVTVDVTRFFGEFCTIGGGRTSSPTVFRFEIQEGIIVIHKG